MLSAQKICGDFFDLWFLPVAPAAADNKEIWAVVTKAHLSNLFPQE